VPTWQAAAAAGSFPANNDKMELDQYYNLSLPIAPQSHTSYQLLKRLSVGSLKSYTVINGEN
jgi:hypothetical protein